MVVLLVTSAVLASPQRNRPQTRPVFQQPRRGGGSFDSGFNGPRGGNNGVHNPGIQAVPY